MQCNAMHTNLNIDLYRIKIQTLSPIYLSVYLSIYLSVCLSVYLSIYLSVRPLKKSCLILIFLYNIRLNTKTFWTVVKACLIAQANYDSMCN